MSFTFEPKTKVHGNVPGLAKKKNSKSFARITGTGLQNGKKVTVLVPPGSTNPTLAWTGKTRQATGTTCTVVLKQIKDTNHGGPPGPRTDPTDVSVTVEDAGSLNPVTVNVGAALIPTGSCKLQCLGTAGTKAWLAAQSTAAVHLVDGSTTLQTWTITEITSTPDANCTIKNDANGQYLRRSSGGAISLGANTSPEATWHVLPLADGTLHVLTPSSADEKFLTGDTSAGTVALAPEPDANNGSSWQNSAYARA
jgi:hypothetical protein